MASFWSKLQIPSLISSKENGHSSKLLRGSSVMQLVVKENVRSLWFRKPTEAIERGTGNCGQPPPKRIVEPCRGCPSRCLEEDYGKPIRKPRRGFFGFRKEPVVIKKKPSNCVEVQPVEEKLTWWEMIVGPSPKRSWPDPCTCRLAHRQKKKWRAHNPKLRDPRYKQTEGDVFLYTEVMRPRRHACLEPQPTPPPSYRVPSAVLFKSMSIDQMVPFSQNTATEDESSEDVLSILKPPRLPYEEMRPPERKRQTFSCRRGIKSEDVLRPIAKDSNPKTVPSNVHQVILQKNLVQPKKNETPFREPKGEPKETTRKRSRVEQLRILVQQKDTLRCMSVTS